jgi:uncharacterized protein (DUF2267 family)
MSTTGLDVFDKTLQTTNIWLQEIAESIGPDRQRCYHALRAVLFALRDRLTPDESAHLAAQLPLLVRGIFYDGYSPAGKPDKVRTREQFLAKINEHLGQIRSIGSDDAARAVFKVLHQHITRGELEEVKLSLPQDIRTLFPMSKPPSRRQTASRAGGKVSPPAQLDTTETKRQGDKLKGAVRKAAEPTVTKR